MGLIREGRKDFFILHHWYTSSFLVSAHVFLARSCDPSSRRNNIYKARSEVTSIAWATFPTRQRRHQAQTEKHPLLHMKRQSGMIVFHLVGTGYNADTGYSTFLFCWWTTPLIPFIHPGWGPTYTSQLALVGWFFSGRGIWLPDGMKVTLYWNNNNHIQPNYYINKSPCPWIQTR